MIAQLVLSVLFHRYILNDTSRNEDGSIPSEGSLKRARKKIEYNLTSVSSFLTPERLKNPMVSKRSVDGQGQSNRPKITHHPKPPLKSFLSDSDVTALSSPQATNNVHFTVKRESPQQGNEINQSAGENVYLECLPQASNGIHCTVTRETPQQGKSTSQSVRENVYPESGQETVANFLRSRKTNLDSSGFRNLSAEARVSGGAFRDCRASEDFSHRKPVNSNQKFLPGLVPSGADCSNWREHCKPLGPADPALSTHLVEASGRSTCRPKRRSERDDTGESRLPSSKLSSKYKIVLFPHALLFCSKGSVVCHGSCVLVFFFFFFFVCFLFFFLGGGGGCARLWITGKNYQKSNKKKPGILKMQ